MFPLPQRRKPAHFRILTAPLKRCSTLYTKCENALVPVMETESVGWSPAWKPWRGALNSAQIRGEPFALLHREQGLACLQVCREKGATRGEGRVSGHCRQRATGGQGIPE